jgi:ribosomal protein S12 methylthiotransferase accessory factor
MGITRIANVTGLDRIGIPVVTVCRPNSRNIAVSQGKGLDLDAARASGLMESVEGYHAERITLPLKLCSYEELRYTHRMVDVSRLPQLLGGVFDPNRQLLWIEGYDHVHGETVWLPFEMVNANYTLASRRHDGMFFSSSNGLASGNHLLEAISHAICEVVERDAATLWALAGDGAQEATRIDLNTVDDPAGLWLLEKLERAGVAIAAWEMTTDIGIPVFRCTIVQRSDAETHRLTPFTGTGCHPSREVALIRALTEAAQTRLTAIAGSRDDMARNVYEGFEDPDAFTGYRERVLDGIGHLAFPGPDWSTETFDQDVEWEIDRLRAAGIERIIAVDLTKQELRIPVVRVVIPGLEPSHRHGPCRYGPRARRVIEGHA